MRSVDIPGGTATFREKLRVRDRELLLETLNPAIAAASRLSRGVITEADMRLTHRGNTGSVIAWLEAWTLPQLLPTMATIGDLDPDVYDALTTAVMPLNSAFMEAQRARAKNFSHDAAADPSSPTVPSSGSATPEQGTPPTSIQTSPTGTENTASVDTSSPG